MKVFFALKIDLDSLPALKTAVIKLKKAAAAKQWDAKFTPSANLHFTVKFIGETADVSDLIASAIEVCKRHAPFSLRVRGLDAFPDKLKARVLWAGVQNKIELQNLYADLNQALSFAEEEFIPHLTLARLRNSHAVRDFLSPFERKDFGVASIDELVLCKSEMRGLYPHYEALERFKLSASV